jgi:hypothetical protein
MPGAAAVEALQAAQGLFPNSNTQALIDAITGLSALVMGIGSRRRFMDATGMHGSYPPTCALSREKLLKETRANATGSGRAPAKYIEVQRQTRNVPRARAREPPCFVRP